MTVVNSWIVKPLGNSLRLTKSALKKLGVDRLPRRSLVHDFRALREAGFETEYQFYDEATAVQVMNTMMAATGVAMTMMPISEIKPRKFWRPIEGNGEKLFLRCLPDVDPDFDTKWKPRNAN